MLSESCDVTDQDVIVLGETATNQAQMYKDAMKQKRNVTFPSDSPIVTPAQAGMRPNLKLRK
jgi:hypothetical protein